MSNIKKGEWYSALRQSHSKEFFFKLYVLTTILINS